MSSTDAVTGAFSYTGVHVADLLLEQGRTVRTLTGHPGRPHGFGDRVDAFPLDFDDPAILRRALEGVDVLYNTYWVRFPYRHTTFEQAVRNTETLVRAAADAGVRRIVHVSIANVDRGRGLPYFDGKAECEAIVRASGCSYGIVRPTVLFGGKDVFISNIAWLLRHFPIFVVAGDGTYGLQPVHVEDHARILVNLGSSPTDEIVDSAGPEAFGFEEFVRLIAGAIERPARLIHMPPSALIAISHTIGSIVRDVVVNRNELAGLMQNLMLSDEEPRGELAFTDWLRHNASALGRQYANEISRHYRGGVGARAPSSRRARASRSWR